MSQDQEGDALIEHPQEVEPVGACVAKLCKAGDRPCRCDQECIATGPCFALADACFEGGNDLFCDQMCK